MDRTYTKKDRLNKPDEDEGITRSINFPTGFDIEPQLFDKEEKVFKNIPQKHIKNTRRERWM